MCCALKHQRHYCSGRVQLNTFTMTVEAEHVWVNHGRQSLPPTDESSPCECGSYSVLKL